MLRPGETDAPDYLKQALKLGNQAQDILTGNFKTDLTGNALLAKSLNDAKNKGLKATIYSHPIGHHGHAAGPTIGMWTISMARLAAAIIRCTPTRLIRLN